MTKDETLKMALDFLMTRRMGAEDVIEALNEALAQPPLLVQEDSCFCHSGVSLQSVSGGAAPEGYLGKVTLLIDKEYVDYVKAQPPLPAQEQQQARVDVITVTLMREGINKHRARELADHFVNFTLTPPLPVQPVQEPVSMRMPKVGDKVICLEDESLGEVVSLTAGGSPDIKFDDGSHGTYLLREFAELFGYVASPLPVQRPWQGMTEFQFAEIYNKWNDSNGSTPWGLNQAIEAKLKELNK